jgi:hypothetical protein
MEFETHLIFSAGVKVEYDLPINIAQTFDF